MNTPALINAPRQKQVLEIRSAEAIQEWLVNQLSSLLSIQPRQLNIHERFNHYGLDSLKATVLMANLSTALGRQFSPTLVWAYPTIESLTGRLTDKSDRPSSSAPTKAIRHVQSEPIAIVGLACRFPGARNAEEYWRLLSEGIDAISEVPVERWDAEQLYAADLETPGKMNTRWGGFLTDVDQFDASFFGISVREAKHMDPQQRIMLELAWEALEDAGQRATALRGSHMGVFIGAMWGDYIRLSSNDLSRIAKHTATGQDLGIIPARISYSLGLEGPSIAINTACSSSLVAVHLACQSIRSGESRMAIAGGVNLMLTPDVTVAMSKLGTQSPDGRCKAFAADANGYVRGEGAGLVVLKPLSQALIDGDPIYCVIRGTAVNNNGFSNGLTAPNQHAQEALLREAYARAGVEPSRVDYVETHGPGTKLGDPVEAKALSAVLCADRTAERRLILSSAKTNIGHVEAAAGIAGLIKVALSIKHRMIPPTLHFNQPNPYIPFDDLKLRVQQKLELWPNSNEPAIAGVNSFGFGGTNAHAVLEEYRSTPAQLLILSAENPESLIERAEQFKELAQSAPLQSVCYTSAVEASGHAHRLAVIAASNAELAEGIESFLKGAANFGIAHGHAIGPHKMVFVFPGQGSQWFGMGHELLAQQPLFREALKRCDEAIGKHVDWSVLDEFAVEEKYSRLNEIEVMWPAIFAVQVALAELWLSWGIKPDAVVGHSIGEVAAAHIAGSLSLDDAARVICHQGRMVKRISGHGAMALVSLSWEQAGELITNYEDRVYLAISSSPHSTVLSGDKAALEEICDKLRHQGIYCAMVKTDAAVHCPQIDPLQKELLAALEGIQPRAALLPMFSTLTAQPIAGQQLDASYWAQNLRQPVLFSQAVTRMAEEGCNVFLEIAPHPILATGIEQCLDHFNFEGKVLASMRRDESEQAVALHTLGKLYTLGFSIEPHGLFPPDTQTISLPFASSVDGQTQRAGERLEPTPKLLVISARTPDALRQLAQSYHSHLTERPHVPLHNLCYTASGRRSHHNYRVGVVADSHEEMAEGFRAFLDGETRRGLYSRLSVSSLRPKLAFVFPGQSTLWLGIGHQLFQSEPSFRRSIERLDLTLRKHGDWSLLNELTNGASASRLEQREIARLVLFAIEIALAELWESWGVKPDLVVGHGIGEVAAAYFTGVLTLEEAARVVCQSSFSVKQPCQQCLTASFNLPNKQTPALMAAFEEQPSFKGAEILHALAAGASASMRMLQALPAQRASYRASQATGAARSQPTIELREMTAPFGDVRGRPARLSLYSVSEGRNVSGEEMNSEYWMRTLQDTGSVVDSVRALVGDGFELFLEMSPHSNLTPLLESAGQEEGCEGAMMVSLSRGEDERKTLLVALAGLYSGGYEVKWEKVYREGGRCTSLPSYPWQRERFWIQSMESNASAEAFGSPT